MYEIGLRTAKGRARVTRGFGCEGVPVPVPHWQARMGWGVAGAAAAPQLCGPWCVEQPTETALQRGIPWGG